jgi:ribosome-binding factor A
MTMTSRRVQKAAEAIREVVSMAILADLRDPRVVNVTVTYVEVAGDMRSATIHVSVMGSDAAQQLCLHGLNSAAGYLQSKVARRIETRYTPRLSFELDMGVKRSIEISRILQSVLPKPVEAPAADPEPAAAEDEEPDGHKAAIVDRGAVEETPIHFND